MTKDYKTSRISLRIPDGLLAIIDHMVTTGLSENRTTAICTIIEAFSSGGESIPPKTAELVRDVMLTGLFGNDLPSIYAVLIADGIEYKMQKGSLPPDFLINHIAQPSTPTQESIKQRLEEYNK